MFDVVFLSTLKKKIKYDKCWHEKNIRPFTHFHKTVCAAVLYVSAPQQKATISDPYCF